MCKDENWRLAVWDIERGLTLPGSTTSDNSAGQDPLAAIRSLSTLATRDGTTLLVLTNFHRFLQSAELVQALAQQISQGKQNRTFIVVLSSVVQIPTELEKQFVVLEHPLPTREQLHDIATGIATDDGELPNADSGVSARMFGTLLTYLNDHESDVFVVCTANDISKLPPELSRAERFDGIFFLDLPGREQKDAIWRMYSAYYQLDSQQRKQLVGP